MKAQNNQQVLNAVLRGDLHSFIRKVFETLDPGAEFLDNWHINAMAYYLSRLSYGHTRRLIITIPPRHLKTISTNVAWVAWMLGHAPHARIICVSYSQDLAIRFSNDTRKVMSTDWYKSMFPKTIISKTKNTEDYFETTMNGFRMATSIGGTLTGIGGDILVIDDPHKAEDARSESALKNAVSWFRETAMTRLNSPKKGRVVVIHQRLHEEDLAGTLLESGNWEHLNLPAIAQQNEEIPVSDSLVYPRKKGEALHHERMSLDDLKNFSDEMGSSAFASQYLQLPGPVGGEIVKLAWFKRYRGTFQRQPGDHIVQCWDSAYTYKDTSDYTVCMTWLFRDYRFYLLDIFRKKTKGSDLPAIIKDHSEAWTSELVVVESNGAGAVVYQLLENLSSVKYRAYNADESKEARLHRFASLIERGQFYLPEEAPWLHAFEQELQYFPNGKYDDQVDALSMSTAIAAYGPGVKSWDGNGGSVATPLWAFPDPASDDPETDPYADLDSPPN